MAADQQVQWEEVQPILGAQPTQQVPFAQYVVNIGAFQGGVLNVGAPGRRAQDLIRPSARPPQILPRRVSGFVDRDQEQRVVGQSLARDQVVDVHGPDGVGKTSLISQTMHAQIPGTFPDGMVYLTARHQAREDLLQSLFECFYETSTDEHVKVNENDVRRYLAGKRALIAVDDCNDLSEDDAAALSQVAPQSALLIAGREPQIWDGAAVALHGLPRDHAIALLQRFWGQPLGEEATIADAVCAALGDMPLAIVKAARTAAGRQVPLRQLLQEVQPQAEAHPVSQAFFMLGHHLSEGERTVLSSIATPNGESVDRRAIVAISALPASDVDRYLARLVKLELVHADGDRYELDEALRPYVRHYGADEAMIARAAGYYRGLAGSLHAHSPDPDEENVIWALRYYFERGDWRQVIEMVRALEPYLATAARWGQWRRRLNDAWHAARQIGDRATEAWVQNQLGVIALGAADVAAARQFFEGALHTYRALGDQTGTTIARWNLQVLLGPPPPPPRRAEHRPPPQGGTSPIVLGLAAIAAVLILGLGVLVVIALNNGDGEVTPPPPITTEVPPIVTTEAPPPPTPQLNVSLAAGCGGTYAPGEALDVRLTSNVNGTVVVYLRAPGGSRNRLFRQDVRAGQTASQVRDVPEGDGQWVLEGDLNNGAALDQCRFNVQAQVTPVVRVWLDGLGCDAQYEAGTEDEIAYQANVDGQVDVNLRDPSGSTSRLFSDRVAAGRPRSQPWQLPDSEGDWLLWVELNGGEASDSCPFTILAPRPPTFGDSWVTWTDSAYTCPGDEITFYVNVFSDRPLARVDLWTRPPAGEWTSTPMERVDDQTYSQRAIAYEEPGLEYFFSAEDERGASNKTDTQRFSAEPCTIVVYDFVASAADAEWFGARPYEPIGLAAHLPSRAAARSSLQQFITYRLEFPGSDTDDDGFALWRDRPVMEDGTRAPGLVLETHPAWVDEGRIFGSYALHEADIIIQTGDVLVAQVGFLSGAGAGDVTFEIQFARTDISDDVYSYTSLSSVRDTYDGDLVNWTIPLDSIAGHTGFFRLLVHAGASSTQDWATWVVARIER